MFNIGDLIVYSGQGICRVDDICDQTYAGVTRTYYVLHPLENSHHLTINTPIENDQTSLMMKLIGQEEAEKILESFNSEGIDWIEKPQLRNQVYKDILKTGNRMEIAKVANSLLRKKHLVEKERKKFPENDSNLLRHIENILFKELATALNTSFAAISEKINSMVQ